MQDYQQKPYRASNFAAQFNNSHSVDGGLLLRIGFAALIISSLALPSGSLFGVPIKHLSYLLCVISLFWYWMKGGKINSGVLVLFFLISAFVIFYTLIGLFNSVAYFPHIILEGTGFFTAVTLVLLVAAATEMQAISSEDLLSYAFYGALIFSMWKVAVVLALVFRIVYYPDVYAFFIANIGYKPVASGIFGGLVRFNFIIYDFVVAFFLFLIPAYPRAFSKVPVYARIVFMAFGTACLVFAFSRLLFALVALLWGYVFLVKISFRSKLIVIFLALLAFTVSLPWLEGAYEQRFNHVQSARSDDIRFEQVSALLGAWSSSPIIGGGLGFYAKDLIRDPNAPFSYEVQWIGFLAKFGMFGIFFLMSLFVLLFSKLLERGRTIDHYLLSFVLACFVLGGFTNQYLVSSASGVFYSIHLLMSSILRRASKDGLIN